MTSSRPWGPDDSTGGPVDDILRSVQNRFPDVTVTRLIGTHPGDDDNVFWIRRNGAEVQVDSGDSGSSPFTVESDVPGSRLDIDDAGAAAEHISRLLESSSED